MGEAALVAFQNIATLERMMFLFGGVLMGLALGAMPGLGGLVGLAILLPFTFDMDPYAAFAVMIGLISVTSTADTIPSVLFGVPGTAASQATIMDGHPMAKNGEAGRAFGAAYTSSLLGGLLGALILALSIPILRPIVLAFGSPEFFMMGILGISMVAVLSGNAPLKGLIAGALGLAIGMVGMDPQTGVIRWSFGQLYLWDGIPLVPIALGIFAIPEIVDLLIRGTRIADVPKEAMKGVTTGIMDAFRHWLLVLRCSAIGVWVGAVPGLGASVVDWFAYGHAMQSEKGATTSFGKGDVRGVIAPESANNAKEGGGLIPTIAFGVPGSASMALLLGAMTIQGLTPGSSMLTTRLDITYTMIWSLAIANILGSGLCLIFTNSLAKIALVRINLIAPLVIAVVFLAAFQATAHFGDLWSLVAISFFGWFMKRFGWPRPPVILGLVLSGIIENYLFISVSRYGGGFLLRPIVLIIMLLVVISLFFGVRMTATAGAKKAPAEKQPLRFKFNPGAIFTLFILSLFVIGIYTSAEWQIQARLFPWVVGIPGLVMCVMQILGDLFKRGDASDQDTHGAMDLPVDRSVPVAIVVKRAVNAFGWVLGVFAAIWIVGFVVAVPLFVFVYLSLQAREKIWISTAYAVGILTLIIGVFHLILSVPWPEGLFPHAEEWLLRLVESFM
ncbi:MAG TPA: tripartite tricarboxylate transporter permease [Verrucomicrobiae bacterium]|nr:tripartite tricarboxylate transporter permease [Verrucomicrobiae bacterium]